MERKLSWLAAIIACAVALLLPSIYFVSAYQSQQAVLATEAEINSHLVSQLINANPEFWELEKHRLETLLGRRPANRLPELRAIYNRTGEQVAEVRDALAPPLVRKHFPIFDAGTPVGTLEIARSLRPILINSALLSLLALALAVGAYLAVKVLPLRAMQKAVTELVGERERGAALQREKDVAEAARRVKAQFLANMSHEIRTPLNGVLGMTELMLGTPLNDEQRRMAETAHGSADVLLRLITDILEFSKIEAGRLDLVSEPFDPGEVVEDVATLFAPQAHAKELAFLADLALDLPFEVVGDSGRLRQVLTSLVANSVKFTDRGEITVSATVESARAATVRIAFAVSDTGIGINERTLARIFEPFTQADEAMSRRYGGTGLGLSISKELVELMGGELFVTTLEGAGTTFRCVIPFSIADAASVSPPDEPMISGRRLLVIGVSEGHARILTKQLAVASVQAKFATNAKLAMATLRAAASTNEPYEAALIDNNLPGLTGMELAQAIRGDASLAAIKILIFAPANASAPVVTASESGIDGWVTTPARRGELNRELARVLVTQLRSTDSGARPPASITPRHVLLAEDNAVNRQVALAVLKRAGHVTHVAENGLQAVQASARFAFDVVLMDCQMPEMDGFEATAAIRAREAEDTELRRLPIIALTANAMAGDREQCLAAGFDDYLAKPFKQQALLEIIERWSARERPDLPRAVHNA